MQKPSTRQLFGVSLFYVTVFLAVGILANGNVSAAGSKTLSVDVTDGGNVTSVPSGIDCPGQCSAQFPDRSRISLTAIAVEGFEFAGWGGKCSGTETTCELRLSRNYGVTAEFRPIALSLDIREVFADQESGTLVLIGGTFISPVVTFGVDQIELSNITVTESVLTTDLPVDLIPGDYQVQVMEGIAVESILLTVGAVGPEGPIGPEGPAGDSLWQLNGLDTYYTDGSVGIGTAAPPGTYSLLVENDTHQAIRANGVDIGIHASTSGANGRAVNGEATSPTGTTYGVYGKSSSESGYGVLGEATSSSDGYGRGVVGRSWSTNGQGVTGSANSSSGATYGGYFVSGSTQGTGVLGWAYKSTGTTYGVYGKSSSVNGFDFFAAGVGVDYGAASSRRWKSNIRNIDDPLGKISQLRGVYYDWDADHGGQHDVGFIAEELGEVMPEIVQYEENGVDAIGLDYAKVTPLLVEALNALLDRVEVLEARINELEDRAP